MNFSERSQLIRWIIILGAFNIIVLIMWNVYLFSERIKEEERQKMELWAAAISTLNSADINADVSLPQKIVSSKTTIPIVLTNSNDSILKMMNVPAKVMTSKQEAQLFFEKIKNENPPIVLTVFDQQQYIYYADSRLLNQLKYYPIALIFIVLFFGGMVLNFYRANKMAIQNKVWAGMAKETAHQIGTPLSSLLGWLTIMKAQSPPPFYTSEIEKDVLRLQTITDRFSKIGSMPVCKIENIGSITQETVAYLQQRSSQQLLFEYSSTHQEFYAAINNTLHSWAIENLIKNAIDATKGKGKITIALYRKGNDCCIKITDNGCGMSKKQHKEIFEPGFTTKKRGWGLGLSLTKRIVNDYHKGDVSLVWSELGKGTEFLIKIPLV